MPRFYKYSHVVWIPEGSSGRASPYAEFEILADNASARARQIEDPKRIPSITWLSLDGIQRVNNVTHIFTDKQPTAQETEFQRATKALKAIDLDRTLQAPRRLKQQVLMLK